MGTVSAFMFDFNGTLSHDESLLCEIYRDLFAKHGRPMTEEQYYTRLAGLAEEAIVGGWLGVDGPLLGSLIAERIETYAIRAADGSTVTEPMREAVRYAAAHAPVAIVSAAFRAEIVPVVEAADLATELTGIVSAEDVLHHKPHPECYLRAVDLLGAEPSSVVAFEDTEAGVAAAKGAGLRCIAVRGTMAESRLSGADEVVDIIDVALLRRLHDAS